MLLLGASPLLAQDQVTFTDELYPGSEDPDWFVSLVVDDLTGEPIAGAEVFLVEESETPLCGEFWFTRRGVTGPDGVLRIPIGDIQGQWHFAVLKHPRHGTCTMPYRPEVWRVGRPCDVPVLVRDWRGQPAPGARIGFCGSCGHGPDLALAVADEEGIAVLRGIDPHNHIADVYVQHPGLGLGYDSLWWHPGDPPVVVECDFAPAKTGRVVDHLGRSLAGAFVSAPDVHRGPWARTGAEGEFTLLGATVEVSRVRTADGREVWFRSPSRYPVTLKLSDPDGDDPHEGTIDVPPRESSADSQEDRTSEPGTPRPVAPTWIEARLVDEAGEPVGARARLRKRWSTEATIEDSSDFATYPSGVLGLAAEAHGLILIEIRPDRPDLHPRFLWASLPERGDDVRVDLGRVVLTGEPHLRVVDSRGEPLPDALVEFARAGLQAAGDPFQCDLDGQGGWIGPDLREGDAVVVRLDEEAVPFRSVLRGAGPWEVRLPGGQLDLEVTADGVGGDDRITVLIGDVALETRGALELRGLPLGPLRLSISAPGHRTALLDTLVGTDPRSVQVTLPRR